MHAYMCVCVCVCVCGWAAVFHLIDKCLGFRLELVDESTKIVPDTFGPFIGHHQGLLACVKSVFKEFWKILGFIT